MTNAGTKTVYVHRAALWGSVGSIFAGVPLYVSPMFSGVFRLTFVVVGGAVSLACIAAILYGNRQTKMFNRRAESGLCIHCGYDLRTKPTHCLECGRENAYLLEQDLPIAQQPLGARIHDEKC